MFELLVWKGKTVRRLLAIAAMAMTVATSAQAITLNFAGLDGGAATITGKTATFEVDGIKGEIEAFSTNYGDTPEIVAHEQGLGVLNGPRDVTYDLVSGTDDAATGSYIDGRYKDDWLKFTFKSAVKLVSVTLGYFNAGAPDYDDHWVRVDGGNWTKSEDGTYSFGGVIATMFSIGATEYDGEYSNDFVVHSVEVAPVPIPASGLMLIGGLAAFGLMRRRRNLVA